MIVDACTRPDTSGRNWTINSIQCAKDGSKHVVKICQLFNNLKLLNVTCKSALKIARKN